MSDLNIFMKETLLTSLIPLGLQAGFSFFNNNFDPTTKSGAMTSFSVSIPDNSTTVGLLDKAQEVLSESYMSLSYFLTTMLFLNILLQTLSFGYNLLLSRLSKTKGNIQPTDSKKKKGLLLSLLKKGIFYVIFFCLYQNIVICLNFYTTNSTSPSVTKFFNNSPALSLQESLSPLEFENTQARFLAASTTPSDGRTIGSLSTAAKFLIVSKDEKTAFVTLSDIGSLQIIDISKRESPVLLSTFKLAEAKIKALTLSNDGKTLYASDFLSLEIINVTNLAAPSLIGSLKSDKKPEDYYRPSIVLSADEKVVWTAAFGFQAFDVSNPKSISLLSSEVHENLTAVTASQDRSILYIAKGNLAIMNASDSKSLTELYNWRANSPAQSVALSADGNTVFLSSKAKIKNGYATKLSIDKLNVTTKTKPSRFTMFSIESDELYPEFLITVSQDNEKLYVHSNSDKDNNLRIIDTKNKAYGQDLPQTVSQAHSIVFSSDQKTVFFVNNVQFVSYQYYMNEKNAFIQAHQENILFTIPFQKVTSLFTVSADEKTLFTYRFWGSGSLEISNISNPKKPTVLKAIDLDWTIPSSLKLFGDDKFLALMQPNQVTFYNVEDLKNPKEIANLTLTFVVTYKFSNNGKTLVTFEMDNDDKKFIRIWDLSDLSSVSLLSTIPQEKWAFYDILLSDDSKTLFIGSSTLEIYNISTLSSPQKLSSTLINLDDRQGLVPNLAISPDNKLIFILAQIQNSQTLKIFNISDPKAPVFLSSVTLPKSPRQEAIKFAADEKILYITSANDGLISLDISNPTVPRILGFSKMEGSSLQSLIVSQKTNKAYLQNAEGLKVTNLSPKHTLFWPTETFKLGYNSRVKPELFRQNETGQYAPMNESHKFVSASLFEAEVVQSNFNLKLSYPLLPKWLTFDKESGVFIVEPNQNRDVKKYHVRTVLSTAVKPESLTDAKIFSTPKEAKDFLITLATLGYLDNDFYLARNFDPNGNLLLPSSSVPEDKIEDIKRILTQSFILTTTQIEVVPSLGVETQQNKFSIQTPTESSINVAIKLEASNNTNPNARFISKAFSSVQAAFANSNSLIVLNGSVDDVNNAFNEIIVDYPHAEEKYQGILTVSDFLNAPVSHRFTNLSEFFLINTIPLENENMSVQKQIKLVPISTGLRFNFQLHPDTFIDRNGLPLNYKLTSSNGKEIPAWINHTGLVISGTPPEVLSSFSLTLALNVSNEYKWKVVPLTLNWKISTYHLAKVIATYTVYLVVALVIWLKISKTMVKKSDKYPKKMIVHAGEEITPKMIVQIGLIGGEIKEAKLLFKKIKELVATKVTGSLDDGKLVDYFIDIQTGRLSGAKIEQTIKDITASLTIAEKISFPLYLPATSSRKRIIDQIIYNDLILLQLNLNSEKETKTAFQKIKTKWFKILNPTETKISRASLSRELFSFGINLDDLDNSVNSSVISTGELKDSVETKLIDKTDQSDSKINMKLLEAALLVEKFNNQNIDVDSSAIEVIAKQKIKEISACGKLKKLLMSNLKVLPSSEKGQIGYGVHFKIEDNTLIFYGTPHRNIQNKTIVIHIANHKGKILKQLKIVGTANSEFMKNNAIVEEDIL